MAKKTRLPAPRRLAFLFEAPARVSFFGAALALEQTWRGAPIGEDGPVGDERVRLRPAIGLAFPASDIESAEIEASEGAQRVRLTTTFLGLYGVDSPLPSAYSERFARLANEESGDRVRSFLDIFHHRILSLLYRSWKKYRPVRAPQGTDPLVRRLMALGGIDVALGLGGDIKPRMWDMRLMIARPASAAGLRHALVRQLGYEVQVEQMVPRTVEIPADQRSRLGAATARLGSTLVVGARVTECNKVRAHITAENNAMFQRLLPTGEDHHAIAKTAERYLRDPVDYDLEVKVPNRCIAPWRIGDRDTTLGQSAWLGRPRGEGHFPWRSKTKNSWT